MEFVLTKKELAERWKCSESAINLMISDGTLTPARKIPGVKFPVQQVMELEGVTASPLSPIERKRLLKKISDLERDNNYLRRTLNDIWVNIADYAKSIGERGERG